VILTVWVPFWELEEDDRVLSVGDELSSWLEFHEADRFAPAERVGAVHGVAHVLPRWPGAEAGRHPTRIDLDGGVLYWDAPDAVEGPLDLAGTVSSNNVDAPDGFAETSGVMRRVRMEWRNKSAEYRYEEVPASSLPAESGITWTGVLIDLEIGD
jgi:hypothetical protein